MVTMRECRVCGKIYYPRHRQSRREQCSVPCRILFDSTIDGLPLPGMVSSCWTWNGTRDRRGYGKISVDNGPKFVHRISWRVAFGEFDPALQVLHRCDNPPCCNPSHLFIGTISDNMRDMVAKGRGNPPRGEARASARLTSGTVVAIRKAHGSGERISAIAKRHGVAWSTISQIVTRRKWTHVA